MTKSLDSLMNRRSTPAPKAKAKPTTPVKTTTLADLFVQVTDPKPTPKAPRRKAQPVVSTVPVPALTPAKAPKVVKARGVVSVEETVLLQAFAQWATATTTADQALLDLITHLVAQESITARRASELAKDALKGTGLAGWGANKVTAVRWTAPLWACWSPADVPTVDGEPISVVEAVAEVRTLCDRLGADAVAVAMASVDEPSVGAYLDALRDAREAKAERKPAPAKADKPEPSEGNGEKTTTDADRIQAVLNTLSGIEGDDTLADALPALVDRITALVDSLA